MSWLFPSVVATTIGSFVLLTAYLWLWFEERENFLLTWALAWAFYLGRFVASLLTLVYGEHQVIVFAQFACALFNAVFLLQGLHQFLQKPMPRSWVFISAAVTAWLLFAVISRQPFLLLSTPVFVFSGCVFVATGIVTLRSREITGVGRAVVGWAFVVWGLHKFDFPLLRPLEWFAPWGFLLGAFLSTVVALGIILIYFGFAKDRLKKGEAKFRRIYQEVPVMMHSIDKTGVVRDVNAKWLAKTGYVREEVIGKDITQFMTPSSCETFREVSTRFWNEGKVSAVPYQCVKKDGAVIDVLLEASVTEDPLLGQISLSAIEDITDRKKAEEELRESEEFNRRIVHHAPMGIIYLTVDGVIWFTNPASNRIFGVPEDNPSPLIGLNIFELPLVAGQPHVAASFKELVQEGKPQSDVELSYQSPLTGKAYILNASATPRLSADGAIVGSVVMIADITARKKAEEALRESEQRYRQLAENSLTGIFIHQDGVAVYVNKKMADILGYTKEEMIGRHFLDAVLPEEREIVASNARARLNGEMSPSAYEIRLVRKTGETIWCEVLTTPIIHRGGPALMGNLADITDRKTAEEGLRESEERYRTLFERAGDGIIVGDMEGERAGRIVSANQMAAEMHGYDMEEFLTLSMSDLDIPEESDCMAALLARVSAGEIVKTEHYHRKKDGTLLPMDLSAGLIEIGRRKYLLSISKDITERKKAEAERLLLATAIEQAAESVEITDADGRIVDVNPAFERTTGYSRGEVIGLKPSILASGEHDQAFYGQLWETLNKGNPWAGNLVNKKKDGRLYEEEVTISPVKNESGRIVNFVAVKRDVTNEILLQKQLLEAQKMEAVGTLSGGIAHDFNNLLQVINGFAEMALFDIQEGQPGHSELREIRHAARSAAELTQGLLTFSRRVESKLRPVDLNRELGRLTKMLRRTLPKMIEIEMDLAEPIDTVNADPAQLHQVIMNLAVNARDAMPDGGRLSIETRNVQLDAQYCKSHLDITPGHYVMLSISDSGTGMDKETRKRIFEPFFSTKETGKGTGLGLSIAFGIVKSHGGNLLCYSEPGHGTTFKIYLPALKAAPNLAETGQSPAFVGGNETILLVDDEDSVRKLASQILKKFGYTVLTAVNGKKGVEVFSLTRQRIDLVILDLIMPQMGGRDCLREILELASETKVIIASGYAANGEIAEAIQEGAKASVRKPYEAQQLLELVRKVLDGP